MKVTRVSSNEESFTYGSDGSPPSDISFETMMAGRRGLSTFQSYVNLASLPVDSPVNQMITRTPMPLRQAELRRLTSSLTESPILPAASSEVNMMISGTLHWVSQLFKECMNKEKDISVAVAAIYCLTEVISRSEATTIYQLQQELNQAASTLEECSSSLSLRSACALFIADVTRSGRDEGTFDEVRKGLVDRGKSFMDMARNSRQQIAKLMVNFIEDDCRILTIGFSRVVLASLINAKMMNKRFRVIIPESRPDCVAHITAAELTAHGIPVTVTTDAAVANIMEDVSIVLLGAEAVVENGGCIGRIGTLQLGMLACQMRKPVYVAAESFKFSRLYPLNQKDLPSEKMRKAEYVPCSAPCELPSSVDIYNPTADYTPPNFITLLVTNVGILTPSAVSDVLIRLYF